MNTTSETKAVKTTLTSTAKVTTIAKAISGIISRRKDWEETAYLRSNLGLWEILGDIYQLSRPIMKMDVDDRKPIVDELNEEAARIGIELGTHDNTVRRCVKLVFGDQKSNRITSYSTTILAANDGDIEFDDFTSWVKRNNGVEEISRKKSKKTVSQKELIDKGEKRLKDAFPIKTIEPLKSVPKDPDYMLLFGKLKGDGKMEVFAYIDKKSIVNSSLAYIGGDVVKLQQEKCGDAYKTNRDEVISKAIANVVDYQPTNEVSLSSSFSAKYPVESFDDYVFPTEDVKQSIKQWMEISADKPLFLYGTHGTGKTTLSKVLPKEMYPDEEVTIKKVPLHKSVGELNKAIEAILNSSQFATFFGACFLIIDEAQAYNPKDLMKLRNQFEESKNSIHFILTSNIEEIDSGLTSRFYMVNIAEPTPKLWVKRMKWILSKEGMTVSDDDPLIKLAQIANGDCRQILQLLETVVYRRRSMD